MESKDSVGLSKNKGSDVIPAIAIWPRQLGGGWLRYDIHYCQASHPLQQFSKSQSRVRPKHSKLSQSQRFELRMANSGPELMPFDEAGFSDDSGQRSRKKFWRQIRRARARGRYRRLGNEETTIRWSLRQRLCSKRTARYAARFSWILAACILSSLATL